MTTNATNSRLSAVREAADDAMDRTASGVREGVREGMAAGESLLKSAEDLATSVGDKLKKVDTDAVVDAAKNQADEFQKMLTAEMKAHPMRTLGIAAVVGLVAGMLVAR